MFKPMIFHTDGKHILCKSIPYFESPNLWVSFHDGQAQSESCFWVIYDTFFNSLLLSSMLVYILVERIFSRRHKSKKNVQTVLLSRINFHLIAYFAEQRLFYD